MEHRMMHRITALCTVFAMLFSSVPVTSFSEGSGEVRPVCSLEEHRHTDECYQDVLVCGREESAAKTVKTFVSNFTVHHHSDACRDDAGSLTCGIAEDAYYHTHNEFCFDEAGNLACGLEEKQPHTHTDSCYDETGSLTCKKPTSKHRHNAECFENGRAVCGKLEVPEFVCTKDNWTEEVVSEGHRHTDACYERRLACGKEEHVHTEACYPAPAPEMTGDPGEGQEEQANSADETPAEEPADPAVPDLDTEPEEPIHPVVPETPAEPEEPVAPENPEESVQEAPGDTAPETPVEPAEPEGSVPEADPEETPQEEPADSAEEEPDVPTDPEAIIPETDQEDTDQDEPADSADEEPEVPADPEENSPETDQEEPADSTEEEPDVPAVPEEPDSPVSQEEPEGFIHFESGYILIRSRAVVYTDIFQTTRAGIFTGYATAWAVSVLREEDPEKDWLQITFDTEEAKTTGSDLLTGYIQAAFVKALTEEETEQLTAELEADPTTRRAGTHVLQAVGFETEKEQAAETTEEPAEEPSDAPAEEEVPGAGEEPAEEPDDILTEEESPESGEEPAEEPVQGPTEVTLASEDAPYKVILSFLSDAGIPEDTELIVTEAENRDATLQKTAKKSGMKMTAGSRNVKGTGTEPRAEVPSLVSWSGDEETPEIVLYRMTLDISLIADGEEIEPEEGTRITVTVTLPGVEDGQNMEVLHYTENGPLVLPCTNDAGTVSFVTDSFSLFTFTSRAQLVGSGTTGLTENTFYGKTANENIGIEAVSPAGVTEGLEILEAYTMAADADLWMALRLSGDPELEPAESIALYAMDEGRLGGIVQEDLSASRSLRFNLGELNGYALVKDTGYRHLEMNLDHVVLDGMMPKGAAADAKDVTAAYRSDVPGEETIAAYDLSILDGGVKVQPEKGPITVTIRDEGIARAQAEGRELRVRHIRDDGTAEEVTDFRTEGDAVIFEATGFSVYTVIEHEEGSTVDTPRVEFHFIDKDPQSFSDGTNAYYAGEAYSFRNKAGDTQHTQILRDGEPLELITDPVNEAERYFYGWYVVDPHVISGTTDQYGIGTSDMKLYYQWPEIPGMIPFETAISIEESKAEIGATLHWSMGGISGSGEVDEDGCAHVFLAPLFENYHFINFMLHPRGDSAEGANNVMTRKMIVLGSSNNVDVKISDIRSTTTDAVHLIFTGWEYNRGTADNPDWVQLQTVDYTGEEMKDPGRDGVYYTEASLAEKTHIDLYPIFILARWVDFVSGVSGSGASFVGSRFLESWGRNGIIPEGMTETPDKNVFEQIPVSTRKGYAFNGWYAFAVTDRNTGEITNLNTEANVEVSYIDNNLTEQTATISTKAIRLTDQNGAVCIDPESGFDGVFTVAGSGGNYKLFEIVTDSGTPQLKLYDPLDRLTLHAGWTPAETKITVIYWTENAENDEYTSNAAKEVYTSDLTAGLGRPIAAGSTITLEDLEAYTDVDYHAGIVSNDILDDVGAVPAIPVQDPNSNDVIEAREEIFYDLDEALSDTTRVIDGQGNTTFNVYFRRKVFKLVFHIGRDNYVKNAGKQDRPNDNWLEYMYKDDKVTEVLGRAGKGQASYPGVAHMTYNGVTYDSTYVTNAANVLKDYVPNPDIENDLNLYIIEAKYGAYIGDRWPSPVNSAFTFDTIMGPDGKVKTPYIWTAYYDSLYYRNAKKRPALGNSNNNNPDINGIHSYMSGDLCANQTGTEIINANQVHHLVCYFGEDSNQNRYKQYHFLKEAVEGVELPEGTELTPGTAYSAYSRTVWSQTYAETNAILGHSYYELSNESPVGVISNLNPEHQLAPEIEGYTQVYSCYDPQKRPAEDDPSRLESHIYFFFTPKQYTLTFMYENAEDRKTDTYYYLQSLADAKKYDDPEKEGYRFLGWYTNEAGAGEPFDFASEKMPNHGLVLYPVFEKLNYVVKIDPNGGEIDRWRTNTTASTGFRTDYKETISPYDFLERDYIPTDNEEISKLDLNPASDVYYYMNAQYISEEHDGNFIPAALRNALYLTESEIDQYWAFYDSFTEEDFSTRHAIKITDKNEWMTAYFGSADINSLPKYRHTRGAEKYIFMGWHQVLPDGTASPSPFNFNTLVTEDVEIRAMWRLDGGYYIQYNPYFYAEEGGENVTAVIGDVAEWTDPANTAEQLYADQSPTHIMRAPTNVTEGWVFRGWRIVRRNGTKTYTENGTTYTYDVWEPIETDPSTGKPVYYQPGHPFTINQSLATENLPDGAGAIIHMQAYYEREDTSERRPAVTNLVLDANAAYGGYVNTTDSGALPSLNHPGVSIINAADHLDMENRPTQILFGDFQSDIALHLYQYATTETYSSVTGTEFFGNGNEYLLLGFDENEDPNSPTTGKNFIPAYTSDAVIGVTRNETDKILYAMWEPMVYVTFVNTTDGDITVDLSGSGANTIHVVNQATGKFSREQITTRITIPAKSGGQNGEVKIVLPRAKAGEDTITATAVNDHAQRRISAGGEYPEGTQYGEGSSDITYGNNVTYTGTLVTDATGILVTYTEVEEPQILYDVNGGEWTEDDPYMYLSGDIYALNAADIQGGVYKPTDPTHSEMVFIGWTDNPDIARAHDFSSTEAVSFGSTTITPDADGNVLDKIRSDYLWDFSRDPAELYGNNKFLYAVWSEAVTVTFDVLNTGNKLHNWTGPETTVTEEPYVYYRSGSTSSSITYTLGKGDRVPKPEDPTANREKTNWHFLKWVTTTSFRNTTTPTNNADINANAFDFAKRVTGDVTLSTSWTTVAPQTFTFTVENNVVNGYPNDEFTYIIAVSGVKYVGKPTGGNTNQLMDPDPDQIWGSIDTTLQNNQQYTVRVTVYKITDWTTGGYSAVVDVYDSDGVLIKTGRLFVGGKQSISGYTSDYKFTLTITQAEKTGYTTTVATKDPFGSIDDPDNPDNPSDSDRSYTFCSSMSNTASFAGSFTPEKNKYDADKLKNGLTVVFTNKLKPLVAPTGLRMQVIPYLLLMGSGLLLLRITKVRQRSRRRGKKADNG